MVPSKVQAEELEDDDDDDRADEVEDRVYARFLLERRISRRRATQNATMT
jgi:hypothetical protein